MENVRSFKYCLCFIDAFWFCCVMEFEPKKNNKKNGFPISTNWLYLCILYQCNILYWRLKIQKEKLWLTLEGPKHDWFYVCFLTGKKKNGFVFNTSQKKTLACFFICLYLTLTNMSKMKAVSFTFYYVLCSYTLR